RVLFRSIGVIANIMVAVSRAVAARPVRHGAGAGWRQLEAATEQIDPCGGHIWNGWGTLRSAIGWRNRRRHRLPPSGRRCRCRQCHEEKEAPPQHAHDRLPSIVPPVLSPGACYFTPNGGNGA